LHDGHVLAAETRHGGVVAVRRVASDALYNPVKLPLQLRHIRLGREEERLGYGPYEKAVVPAAIRSKVQSHRAGSG